MLYIVRCVYVLLLSKILSVFLVDATLLEEYSSLPGFVF